MCKIWCHWIDDGEDYVHKWQPCFGHKRDINVLDDAGIPIFDCDEWNQKCLEYGATHLKMKIITAETNLITEGQVMWINEAEYTAPVARYQTSGTALTPRWRRVILMDDNGAELIE